MEPHRTLVDPIESGEGSTGPSEAPGVGKFRAGRVASTSRARREIGALMLVVGKNQLFPLFTGRRTSRQYSFEYSGLMSKALIRPLWLVAPICLFVVDSGRSLADMGNRIGHKFRSRRGGIQKPPPPCKGESGWIDGKDRFTWKEVPSQNPHRNRNLAVIQSGLRWSSS